MRQLRICGLGDYRYYYSYFLYGITEGAIRNGAWFRPVSLVGQSLVAVEGQIRWFKPHILLCHMIFNKENREQVFELLRKIKKDGTIIIYHLGDARAQPRYVGDISDIVDFVLMNHGLLKEFSNIWKVPTYHWPYMSLYQKDIAEKEKQFSANVVFTGTLARSEGDIHTERTLFIEKLKERINVTVYPCLGMTNTRFQTAEVATSANVIMNVQMAREIPLYLDVRPFQYIGAGALYFHDESEAMDKFFKDGVHYVKYKRGDVDDFVSKYNYYVKKKPKEGNKIRRQGFKFCQTFHSTKERMEFVIDIATGKDVKNRIYLEDLLI